MKSLGLILTYVGYRMSVATAGGALHGSVLNCSEVHFWNIMLKSIHILSAINAKMITVLLLSEVRMNNAILDPKNV